MVELEEDVFDEEEEVEEDEEEGEDGGLVKVEFVLLKDEAAEDTSSRGETRGEDVGSRNMRKTNLRGTCSTPSVGVLDCRSMMIHLPWLVHFCE